MSKQTSTKMESNYRIQAIIWLLLASFMAFTNLNAQEKKVDVRGIVLHYDSLFWKGYNTCDTSLCGQFLTSDVEFYHDKGGITSGAHALLLSIKNNVCGNDEFRIRREEVAGTVNVFPMQKGDIIYGATISGEHIFYLYGKNKQEQLDGRARFTHLWILKDGKWKMSRVLSYDHHAAVQ